MKKVLAAAFVAALIAGPTASAAVADNSVAIEGAGSTWSQIAVDQWRADVKSRQGLKVNYTGTGSSAGRSLYYQGKVDFAVSEIPFIPSEIKILKGLGAKYQYLPIVAGGTALMYNVKDTAGRQVTNLRLSPATVAGIFTGKIKNWSDAKITADNSGRALPSRAIIPVVRSDGSGTSAQFSAFLESEQHSAWASFATANGYNPNESTSNYPIFTGSIAQSGSDGVANYVANKSTGVGSIGYVETGYAVQRGFPVAALKNASGNYVLPEPENVGAALTKATLNKDRTQNLIGVYRNTAKNSYPMSSYSYMITPTAGINPDHGAVLSKFMLYFACDGQKKASVLGYAPLPPNLVQIVFDAVRSVPGHVAVPDKATKANCGNPTFTGSLGEGGSVIGGSNTGGGTGTDSGTGTGTGTDTGSGTGTDTGTGTGTDTGSGTGTDTGTDTGSGTGTDTGTGSGDSTYAALQPINVSIAPRGSNVPLPAVITLLILVGPALAITLARQLAPAVSGFMARTPSGRRVRRGGTADNAAASVDGSPE